MLFHDNPIAKFSGKSVLQKSIRSNSEISNSIQSLKSETQHFDGEDK